MLRINVKLLGVKIIDWKLNDDKYPILIIELKMYKLHKYKRINTKKYKLLTSNIYKTSNVNKKKTFINDKEKNLKIKIFRKLYSTILRYEYFIEILILTFWVLEIKIMTLTFWVNRWTYLSNKNVSIGGKKSKYRQGLSYEILSLCILAAMLNNVIHYNFVYFFCFIV